MRNPGEIAHRYQKKNLAPLKEICTAVLALLRSSILNTVKLVGINRGVEVNRELNQLMAN